MKTVPIHIEYPYAYTLELPADLYAKIIAARIQGNLNIRFTSPNNAPNRLGVFFCDLHKTPPVHVLYLGEYFVCYPTTYNSQDMCRGIRNTLDPHTQPLISTLG